MARYIIVVILLAAIMVCPGCEEYQYSIEMTPDGDTIKRTISFSSNLPDEEKRAVEKFYPDQIDTNTFSGAFRVEIPNDVGGAGYYTYLATSMGSTATYKERFRGDDDLNQHIVDFQVFVDRYVDFTINWLEFELGKEPNFGNLRTFLDKNLRTDARNFGLYLGLSGVVGRYDSNAADEFHQRVVLYFEQRGYIEPGRLDILTEVDTRSDEELRKLVRNIIAREMGCCREGEDSNKLAFLDSSDSIEKSVIRYIRSTERYQQMREEEKLSKNDANLPPPDVDIQEFISGGAPIPFEFNLFGTTYKVNVCLKCPCKPFKTNGQWQEVDKKIFWSEAIKGKYDLPTFFYASWSEPNNDFQSRHFGRVILEGKNLADYCYWEKSIEAERARQWNEFLSGIDPNMEIAKAVKKFRFADESAEPNAFTLANVPCTLILNALPKQ